MILVGMDMQGSSINKERCALILLAEVLLEVRTVGPSPTLAWFGN